ncbi:hypothetical protein ACLB90_05275 [Stenotrophomonas sp. LGBM10]|uniref:hypothetical protein n=1 Tax=Stenotrophomonas sp. LGBM10 TaxID=3390038 RepID=UPI00398B936B
MKHLPSRCAAFLAILLSATAPAAPAQFTDYTAFYRSLGDTLFQGPGTALARPCTESPRHCVWVTSMRQALRRYDQPLWTTPGDLDMAPPAGVPDVAFDGEALVVGTQRWPLHDAVNLAPPPWKGNAPVDPENLAEITLWHRGASKCLDIRHVSSGYGDRYTTVVLLHADRLYVLPPLFGTCAAIRSAPHAGFRYPSNAYLGVSQENQPDGLQVDYLLSDGKTRLERYRLRFPEPGYPFVFDAVRE